MGLELPELRTTEDAEHFGRSMTRDQWIFCLGARDALQREFNESRIYNNGVGAARQLVIAVKIQLLREAMEEAPFPTLVEILKRGNAEPLKAIIPQPEDLVA